MRRAGAILALAVLAAGCQAGGQDHASRLATEEAVTGALNGAAGPDYARALKIIEAAPQSATQRDTAAGNLMLSACREGAAFCAPPHDAAAGIARLSRAAMGTDEDARIAAGHLATWFERGAGAALPADPARASCWQGVADGPKGAADCTRTAPPR